jgi:hypothetical protein
VHTVYMYFVVGELGGELTPRSPRSHRVLELGFEWKRAATSPTHACSSNPNANPNPNPNVANTKEAHVHARELSCEMQSGRRRVERGGVNASWRAHASRVLPERMGWQTGEGHGGRRHTVGRHTALVR